MTLIFLLFLQTDQRQMHFCVNLDPPIKQGQTRYHFLVFNFKVDEEEEIELPFTDEEVKEKFDGKLEREISGPTYEVNFLDHFLALLQIHIKVIYPKCSKH